MPRRKIIFRADGGPAIGMGHFIRTLALAEMLKDDFYCIYATQTPTIYQINEIGKVCLERIDLPANETHFNVFLNLLAGDEIVVLDNYFFSTEYQNQIKKKNCKLVCIDDMHDKHFVSDIVINHAEGINQSLYSGEKYTKFLLGYKYALLRKEYLSKDETIITKQYSCFLMMGGADPLNISVKLASILVQLNLQLPIAVVVGATFPNEQQFKRFKNIVCFKGISAADVFQLMQQSVFGILPASTVAIEACAARLPFICGYFIENQKEIYSGIKNNELAICVGNILEIKDNQLIEAIEKITNSNISESIKTRQIDLLDKKSKERFIKIFKQL